VQTSRAKIGPSRVFAFAEHERKTYTYGAPGALRRWSFGIPMCSVRASKAQAHHARRAGSRFSQRTTVVWNQAQPSLTPSWEPSW
jgi:hypothetical protein